MLRSKAPGWACQPVPVQRIMNRIVCIPLNWREIMNPRMAITLQLCIGCQQGQFVDPCCRNTSSSPGSRFGKSGRRMASVTISGRHRRTEILGASASTNHAGRSWARAVCLHFLNLPEADRRQRIFRGVCRRRSASENRCRSFTARSHASKGRPLHRLPPTPPIVNVAATETAGMLESLGFGSGTTRVRSASLDSEPSHRPPATLTPGRCSANHAPLLFSW